MALISVPGPLLDRKRRLHRLIPANDSHLLYVEHLDGDGQRFFELVCEQDLEGIICKPKTSPYPFTWIKVKNPATRRRSDAGNGLSVCYRNDRTKPDSSFPTAFALLRW